MDDTVAHRKWIIPITSRLPLVVTADCSCTSARPWGHWLDNRFDDMMDEIRQDVQWERPERPVDNRRRASYIVAAVSSAAQQRNIGRDCS